MISTILESIPKKRTYFQTRFTNAAKHLFQIMDVLLKTKPDDAVYLFIDKELAQVRPYYIYMTADVNKFLRIYYGRVKE